MPKRNERRIVYHGTSSEHLDGLATGVTDDLLYLTVNMGNAEQYAYEKVRDDGGEPVIFAFDLDVLAKHGRLEPDWKWLPRRLQGRDVDWEEALAETGHVTFEGRFGPALLVAR